ncbi:MAG: hypothetical protein HQM08_14505 [Candidatus Riflebacteria bacterium]|nr:hypothetical protein [Candidatus Riflebacteria bacterium]
MMLVLVLAVILILGIFGMSLNSSVSELANWASSYSTSILMDHVAFEIAGTAFYSLGKSLSDPTNSNFQAILKGSEKGKLTVSRPSSSAFSELKNFTISVNFLEVEYEKTSSLAPSSTWKDPREKLFKLTLTLEIAGGRSKYRMLRRLYRFVQLGKVQRLGLPLISKFTFFLKNPEETNETNVGYNCYENFIDGERGQTSKILPLTLVNTSLNLPKTDIQTPGWVYLGSDKEIQLHLTSGNDPAYGELFQLASLEKPERGAPMFVFNDLPKTSAFSKGVKFTGTNITAKVGIRGSYFGFYKWDKKNGSDMNFQGVLQKYFASEKSRTMGSSFLHLYGNFTCPSPTLVLGKVSRIFAYYSGLIYDASGDGKAEKFLDFLESPPTLVSQKGEENFWNTVPIQVSFPSKNFNQEYLDLPPDEVAAETLFTSKEEYLKYASKIVMEPFNKGYDYMLNQAGTLPPPEKFPQIFGKTYEQSGESVQILDKQENITLFDGNITTFSTKDLLIDRVSQVISTPEIFASKFLTGNSLDLHGKVILVDGPLELPAAMEVVKPGILCAKGKITLRGGIKKCPIGPLTLVSLGDDIELQAVNEEIWAHLVALDGTIFSGNNSPVKICGALAAKTLNPLESKGWPGGGTITYDDRLSPFRSDRDQGYVINLADYFDKFQVEKVE